jgi:heme exporter protein D
MDLDQESLNAFWFWLGIALAFWAFVILVSVFRRDRRNAKTQQTERERRMKGRG